MAIGWLYMSEDPENRPRFSVWRILFWLAVTFVVGGLLLVGICTAALKF
jgi:hypothetical protein